MSTTYRAYEVGVFSTGNLLGKTRATPGERLHGLVKVAQRAEQAGFDIFAVGEAHKPPAVISSPAVLLAYVAAATATIRLSTAVTLITLNDPVKVAEEYSTLQNLCGGRLGLMIGRGVDTGAYKWYGLDPDETVAIATEKYELLRRLWSESKVDWTGAYRPALEEFTVTPRPLTDTLPGIWHTSPRTKEMTDVTASYGEGYFANYVRDTPEGVAEHVHYFRARYEAHGHGPAATAPVGSGAKIFIKPNSQDARSSWEAQGGNFDWEKWGFASLEDAFARSATTVGSPEQVLDKIGRFQELYGGYQRQLFSIDQPGGTVDQMLEQIDLIGEHILPVLRATYDRELDKTP